MKNTRSILVAFPALLVTAFLSSCAYSPDERQAYEQGGLFGVIAYQREQDRLRGETLFLYEDDAEFGWREYLELPVVDELVEATASRTRPGFVYSPYADGPKLVDARGLEAGSTALCPYTRLPFIVPKLSSDLMEQPMVAAVGDQPLQREATLSVGLPLGIPVPGKPHYLYSPFAKRTQIVDISGMSPGQTVRCPFTGEPFQIPADAVAAATTPSAELVTGSFDDRNATALKAGANGQSDKPAPRNLGDLPLLKWDPTKSGFIRSPFTGSWIDARGQLPGSILEDPDTGEPFRFFPND